MGYPAMVRKMGGTRNSTGLITLKQDPVGFFVDQGSTSVYVADTPLTTWDIQLTGTATVSVQGNEGNPTVAADWYDISTINSSGVVKDSRHTTFTRVNVDAYTSGTVTVRLSASQS